MSDTLTPTLDFFSVTSLIDAALGNGEALIGWAAGVTAEAAVDEERIWKSRLQNEGRDSAIDWLKRRRFEKSDKAKLRGTDLHKAAEQIALGEPVVVDDVMRPYVLQLSAWLMVHRPSFHMAEAPVYNPEYRYAGTCDGILTLPSAPDTPLIVDYKTTDKPPDSAKSRPPYPEVALQLCAYSRCTEVGVVAEQRYTGRGRKRYYIYDPTKEHEPMPRVAGALCIVVSPYDCFAVPVRIDDHVWSVWLGVLRTAGWRLRPLDLFGPPLLGPGPTALEHQLRASVEALS